MKPTIFLISCSVKKNGNSDLSLNYAKEAVIKRGCNVKLFYLRDYQNNFKDLYKKIESANGIIFATPVHFGDSSSLLWEFLQFGIKNNISLLYKVVGFISIGAKRNGGQETTIEHNAWDVMEMSALVVNDGYPISQFGGVCVSGVHGSIGNDKEGIEVVKALGNRVAETCLIIQHGDYESPIKILYLLMDEKYSDKLKMPAPILVDYGDIFRVLKTYDYKFDRCFSCDKCPNGDLTKDYKCINVNDDMRLVHQNIVDSNVIIPWGLNMRFIERTRYLRRDNYRLTYSVIRLNNIRQVHIFIKENSILCRKAALTYGKLIESGRKKIKLTQQIYEPVGYEK